MKLSLPSRIVALCLARGACAVALVRGHRARGVALVPLLPAFFGDHRLCGPALALLFRTRRLALLLNHFVALRHKLASMLLRGASLRAVGRGAARRPASAERSVQALCSAVHVFQGGLE